MSENIMGGAFALADPVRGLVSAVRAEADPIVALNKAFAEFKAKNDERLALLEKGKDDVVRAEEIAKINAAITDLNAKVIEAATKAAAREIGAGGSDDPAKREHRAAFHKWFREGEGDLKALHELAVKAKVATNSKPDGGYVVPDTMETTIDRVLGRISAVRGLARVVSIGTGTYKKLVNMGGAASGWVGEEQARPETGTPTLREIVLNVKTIYANPYATQDLLDDAAVDIEAWLAAEVQTEFAEQEGRTFVSGDGVLQPRGFLTYPTVANAGYAAGANFGSIGFVNTGGANGFVTPSAGANPADALIQLLFALRQGYRNGATFIMNDTTQATVRQFKDADGRYIWAPPTASEAVPTILGKPVVTDDNMPDVAAGAFPIAVADWSRAYTIVDRRGISVLRDPYTAKPNVAFYTTKRVGGGVTMFEAIKLLRVAAS